MKEYIHRAREPIVAFTFDADAAQSYADSVGPIPREGSHDRAVQQFSEFSADFGDRTDFEQTYITNTLTSYVEHVPEKLDRGGGENLWHIDFDPNKFTFELINVGFGASSHPTEIVYGDVKFKHDITKERHFNKHFLREVGQRAVDDAIARGDAQIYKPAAGEVVEFRDKNIHRRNQSPPVHDLRFAFKFFPISRDIS